MRQLNTEFKLEKTLCLAITEWFETGNGPLQIYPGKFHDAIWSQGVKRRYQICNWELLKHLLEHQ